jgi:hypothetical protein
LWTSKLTNSIVNAEFNDFKGVVKEIENNPKAFGVDTKGGFDVATGAKIKEMFPGTSFGTMQDDAVYEFNKKDPQRNEIITKPEFFDFDGNGGLDENGKNTMWNLLGVDDYEQAIFSNPTEMKLVYPNYKPSASSYQKK